VIYKAKYNDFLEYIKAMILVFSAMGVKRVNWLTDRERDFFAATVLNWLYGEGCPISDEALSVYQQHYSPNVNRAQISDKVNRLVKKKWLQYDSTAHRIEDIPFLFKDVDMDAGTFEFKLIFKGNDTLDRPDSNPDGADGV